MSIRYRVANPDALPEQHWKNPVTNPANQVETTDYGKFIHLPDLEGNKMELWVHNDGELKKPRQTMGTTTTK